MPVRHSLLALLSAGPTHGYGLKTEFEAATGDVWPLNVGQVYTTLGRLERDGLVIAEAESRGDLAWLLMLDALVFQAEAEARWLDMCEARLARENIAVGVAQRHPGNSAERAVERSS